MTNNIRINIQSIKYLLMFIPFMTVSSYLMSSSLNTFVKMYRLIIVGFSAYLYLKRNLMTKADFFFYSAHMVVLLSTFIYNGTFSNQLYRTVSVIGFMMMFKVNVNENPKRFLKVVSIYGCFMSFLTAISMYWYYQPGEFIGGMRKAGVKLESGRLVSGNWYLLGLDNSSFFYIFPVMIICAFYLIQYKGRVSKAFYALYIFITSAFFYVESAAAMICFVFGGLMIYVIDYKKVNRNNLKILNYNKSLVVIIVFALSIVVFRLQYIFEPIIVDMFHKSITLTRRTEIWDTAFTQINNRPLIGVGAQSDIYNYLLFRVSHVHNIILEWLYEGGIVSLLCFIYAVYLYGKSIGNCENQKTIKLISGGIIVYFFNTCIDFYTYVFLPYSMLVLAEYIKYNNKQTDYVELES